jgi:hypothetical protein
MVLDMAGDAAIDFLVGNLLGPLGGNSTVLF